MSKDLTLWELIASMKIGELAECIYSPSGLYIKGRVMVRTSGGIFECGESDNVLELSKDWMETKWRILPRYVSLEDAMQAIKDGATVRCYPENDGGYIEFSEADSLHYVASQWTSISVGTFFGAKWTIEED